MTTTDTTAEKARELLLDHLPIGSDWTELRAAISDGTISLHSDPMSWAIEGALAALQATLTASPAQGEWIERESAARAIQDLAEIARYRAQNGSEDMLVELDAAADAFCEATSTIRALPSAPKPQELAGEVENVVRRVLTDVCELPDRNSPDDDPDMLLITTGELETIVRRALGEDI